VSRTFAVGIAVTALILLGVTLSCVYSVYQTQQAIIVEFGAPQAIVSEPGLHFKTPWQQVYYFERQLLNLDAKGEEVIALDKKRILVDAFARWRITDPLLFYKRFLDQRTAEAQLAQILSSDIRRVLGAQDFAALLSARRADLMHAVRGQMNADVKGFGVAIADVRLRRADLPAENGRAVYQRMQKEREREAAEYRAEGDEAAQSIRADADLKASVVKAEAEKQAEILKGEGDAGQTRIMGAAYGQDPDFAAFWRSMQAYRDTFAGGQTTVVLSPKSAFFKYFGQAPGGGKK
jgi:modulator of FtsH protease HflC